LERTDALAFQMGLNVQDLTEVLGISRVSLFCCRSGSRPISRKTWLKLEEAERKAAVIAATGQMQGRNAELAAIAEASGEPLDGMREELQETCAKLLAENAELRAKLAAARKLLDP
jgi:hypothetical protein